MAFGKAICERCKDSRPRINTGNSGMTRDGQFILPDNSGLTLLKVPKGNSLFGSYYFEHYPGSKGIVGRSLCYLIHFNSEFSGIIGCNSSPSNYKLFRKFFDITDDNFILNNNVFRLIYNGKNFGTKVLKLFRETIKKDYLIKYKTDLKGIITFVEPPRTGAVYKADNWTFLGLTEGKSVRRGISFEKEWSDGTKKLIFGYKYK